MKNLKELIEHLQDGTRVLENDILVQAFYKIDRKDFLSEKNHPEAYEDYPLSIGHNQTISQPTTVAFMLELLDLKKGQKVLDIGSGSAWTTALLAEVVGKEGQVFGLEIIPDLLAFGKINLNKYKIKNVKLLRAKNELGLKKYAPYDRILVSAEASKFPDVLVDQLKDGGTLVFPWAGSLWKVKKNDGKITNEQYSGFSFVPLVED